MIELVIIFITILGLLIVGLTLLHLGNSPAHKAPSSSTFANTDFMPTQMYLDNTSDTGIAINESTKSVCVIQSSSLPPQLINFTDLVASFVVKNETIIQKTLRTSPKELAAIAKDMQNKVGARPEQASTNPSSGDQTQKIDLSVVIKNQEHPIHTINFLDMDTKEDGIIFNKAMVSAKHWHHLMSDLIQQANGQDRTSDSMHEDKANTQTPTPSVADELIKLDDLLKNNVICQSDFDRQKEKLLAPH